MAALVALRAATAAVNRSLTLDLDFTVVFIRVMVVVVVVVFVVGAPDRQGNRSVRRYAVLFPVVARPGRTTVECVQAALAPQQARPRRSGVSVFLAWPVRSKSHLSELTRIDFAKELLVGSASRAAFVESVLEDAFTFTAVGMTRRTTTVGPVLHSDAGRRTTLRLSIAVLFFITASWRLGRATGKVVEAVSVPALRRGVVTIGQVVGGLAVALTEARHGWWALGEVAVSVGRGAVVGGAV
jgi:hypothetical protein